MTHPAPPSTDYASEPWEHPDWYDLHDTAFSAGSEREPEHYREFVLSLPPLTSEDHVLDAGAGTGKLSALVAAAYPDLGYLTLVEPNAPKLRRASSRLAALLSADRVTSIEAGLGRGAELHVGRPATQVIVGSVLMPMLELRPGTLRAGLQWVDAVLAELRDVLAPGGWLYLLETLKLPWKGGGLDDPCRRLGLLELQDRLAPFSDVEIIYRFRDRVIVKSRR